MGVGVCAVYHFHEGTVAQHVLGGEHRQSHARQHVEEQSDLRTTPPRSATVGDRALGRYLMQGFVVGAGTGLGWRR